MTFSSAIQILLAIGSLASAWAAFMMYRQGERNRSEESENRNLLKKQYLRSIAPIVRVAERMQVCGREKDFTCTIENLKPGCPPLGVCAIACMPGLGLFADKAYAAFKDCWTLQLKQNGAKQMIGEITGDYGVREIWSAIEAEVAAGATRGTALILYRDVDRNGYYTRFSLREADDDLRYVFGSERNEMIAEQDALNELTHPAR